jgi:hypothetical protein
MHPTCGVLSCCQRKGFEYCFLCGEFPCKKYDSADSSDSFITHKNQFIDMEKAKLSGMDAYKAELDGKIAILEELLRDYDDGRRKGFFCIAVNLLEMQNVNAVMAHLSTESVEDAPTKERAMAAVRLFEDIAGRRDVSLKLRKNPK